MLEAFIHDAPHALRLMRRERSFTFAALATLTAFDHLAVYRASRIDAWAALCAN